MTNYFVGLMSGTSLDAIDCVVVDFSSGVHLLGARSYDISHQRRQAILDLCQPGDNEIDKMGLLDRQLGLDFAHAVNQTLSDLNIDKQEIVAIGSHGQTIRHRPENSLKFTLQIGDPNTIAYETGIDTIADFRRMDIAAGGQGAPLVPAFHKAIFNQNSHATAVLNIGGMANVSLLQAPMLGYDTGPGNVLIDHYCRQFFNQPYDSEGNIAARGHIIQPMLQDMLQHPFFQKPAPKSCGRENFDNHWADPYVEAALTEYSAEDIITTLTEFTAVSICQGLALSQRQIDRIIVCGGGAFNSLLLQRIAHHSGTEVSSSIKFGVDPQWVEGIAFAWFAKRTLNGLDSNAPSVTGAEKAVVLGAHYRAN